MKGFVVVAAVTFACLISNPSPTLAQGQAAQPPAQGQGADNEAQQRQQFAQFEQARGRTNGDAEQRAQFDLTGYWVAVVTEDWRWRMLTPPKGDYASVPLNPAGKQVADQWTEAQDGSCKAYGAAGLMRMPTRLHITWASPNVLKIETDWGQQTRLLYFNPADAPHGAAPSPQGISLANWVPPIRAGAANNAAARGGNNEVPRGGRLKVTTFDLTPGWLRRNGVPYSDHTKVTEFFQVFPDPLGRQWFDVTTIVDDPQYLLRTFITSSDFRKEADGSKWSPHPCKTP